MVNVSKHSKDKFAERVKGIKDFTERNLYVSQNSEQIEGWIREMYDYSQFLWSGQLGANSTSATYRIKGDVVLLLDTKETAIVTLFRANFGFPQETNLIVIRDLVAEIVERNEEAETERVKWESAKEVKQQEADSLDSQIRNLQEQLSLLQSKKKILSDDIELARCDYDLKRKEAEKYAIMLCNTVEFRNDLKNMKVA
jgi:hypothetical protein